MKSLFFFLSVALILCFAMSAQAAPKRAKAVSSSPSSQADEIVDAVVDRLWLQNDAYWHEGDYPRIIALDRIITQADPNFLECFATGGWLMESLGKTQDAEAFYQSATQNNAKKSYAWHTLGMFYFNTAKDFGAAVKAFETGARQQDAEINDWKMVAHSYAKLQKWDKAVATWRAVKARWPQGAAVEVNLQRAIEAQKSAASSSSSSSSNAR